MRNAHCPDGIPGQSHRTSLRARAAGRGTRVGESGAGRDRGGSGTHRSREGRCGDRPWLPSSPIAAARQDSSVSSRGNLKTRNPDPRGSSTFQKSRISVFTPGTSEPGNLQLSTGPAFARGVSDVTSGCLSKGRVCWLDEQILKDRNGGQTRHFR
jgi:hypothetical protein